MTSSLVGSEMCIRDSDPAVSGPSRRGDNVEPAAFVLRWREAPPLAAVSYTHLTLPTICSV
eukprot:1595064-Prorocentrum_lima.AAC.1